MKIDQTKTNVTKVNTKSREHVTIGDTNIEEVTAFVNLGSKITTDGKSMADILSFSDQDLSDVCCRCCKLFTFLFSSSGLLGRFQPNVAKSIIG